MTTMARHLKILFVGAELAPFAKVGGLGEVLFALPRAMRGLGHDVRAVVPNYASVARKKYTVTVVAENLKVGGKEPDPYGLTTSNVLMHEGKETGVTYFLENMEYYEKRANVYGYIDDTARWVLLCRGVIEFLRVSDWVPDVIVANDWATGFLPNLLRTEYRHDPVVSDIPVVFLIHNLRNQGMFDAHFIKETDKDSGTTPVPGVLGKGLSKLNGMRRGIMYADLMSTVSPTYAKEILTAEFGERLEDALKSRKSRLTGILNGIDQKKYNPSHDRDIRNKYTKGNLDGRRRNKLALQRIFKVPLDQDVFTIGFVGRLDEQKGINLFSAIAPALFENIPFQFFLVGTGDKDYRMFFKELKEKYPDRVGVHLFFDEKLPKQIFAGADALIMPSRFEPAGLVQMEAMRYGCVPIVRNTGGLADTVVDFNPLTRDGTGFVFGPYDPMGLFIAIIRAYEVYRDRRRWKGIVMRGMSSDFSWDTSAREHVALYRKAIAARAG